MTERQIEEEILRYIQDQSYNYAVLIDGEWGSGKTYFVTGKLTNSINELERSAENPRKVKYVSLYGCKKIEDVKENIAWTFSEDAREWVNKKTGFKRPKWLRSKKAIKASENILLTSRKIGNAIMKKCFPETSLYSITSDWLNLGSYIFVIDDLERSECSVNELFGFLNELVEHEATKVILIANEKEISGIVEPGYLEQQYMISMDNRIEWDKKPQNYFDRLGNQNKNTISLNELEYRRKQLFPDKERNEEYRRISEKLVGVTLKYEPDIASIISTLINETSYDEAIKRALNKNKEYFVSTMKYYRHTNLRTFQFFLSKVSYILERISKMRMDEEYKDDAYSHVVTETFIQAVRYKSNYKPPKFDETLLKDEQEKGFKSIKVYIESGTYDNNALEADINNLLSELKAKIGNDDPYFMLYQQYYYHEQPWCEEQLELLLDKLKKDRYPLSIYGKIIVIMQRLMDLGFNEKYMERTKSLMLKNISNMGEVDEIDPDMWYVEDPKFKKRVIDVVSDLNNAIKNHSQTTSRENITEILEKENWVDRLEEYIKSDKDFYYVEDVAIFAKASVDKWMEAIYKSSPSELDGFRVCLGRLYPHDVVRNAFLEDAETIYELIGRLKEYTDIEDIIKKANIGWITGDFERIAKFQSVALGLVNRVEDYEEKEENN